MEETGIQNPIFKIAKYMEIQGSAGAMGNINSMNPGMNPFGINNIPGMNMPKIMNPMMGMNPYPIPCCGMFTPVNMPNNVLPPQQNNQFINVYFRAVNKGENNSIMILCSLNDKISDLIEKYRTKSLEDISEKKFIFNAKALNPSLTVAECGLIDGANIFVVNTARVKGAQMKYF